MIFLVFLYPVAIYLLILGLINRRSTPMLAPGTWDFVGVLFAASGFLLCGGPAILTSLSERWRLFWLAGPGGDNPLDDNSFSYWAVFAAVYLIVVVGGAILVLRGRRNLTAVYNVEPGVVEKSLTEVFDRMGLNPLRSGNLYLFGTALGAGARKTNGGVQAPHSMPRGTRPIVAAQSRAHPSSLAGDFLDETAVLEVDSFELMRHVSLRWDPHDSALRREVESELAQTLAQNPSSANALGEWLNLVGLVLLGFTFLGTFFLVLTRLFPR